MKPAVLICLGLCGLLLAWGTVDFPGWGDPAAPAATHVSPYYIEHALTDTAVPNIVTAVLADYRGFDTMFETAVIFSAGVACFVLLRVFRRRAARAQMFRHVPTGITFRIEEGRRLPVDRREFEAIDSHYVPYDLIVRTTARLVIPFIQVFALYVVAHGHHSPGGGFQGGVIFGAAVILYTITFDLRTATRRLSERTGSLLSTAGIVIYAGTGLVCLLLGANFLDYSRLTRLLPVDPVMARSHGILIVEIGVALAVSTVMVLIYYILSSRGRLDEGL